MNKLLTTSSMGLTDSEPIVSTYSASIYDLAVAQTTPSSIVFHTNLTVVSCYPCAFPVTLNTVVAAIRTTCISTISLATEDIIYTLVSRSLEVSVAAIPAAQCLAYCFTWATCMQGTARLKMLTLQHCIYTPEKYKPCQWSDNCNELFKTFVFD